jgi:hypothetical protein
VKFIFYSRKNKLLCVNFGHLSFKSEPNMPQASTSQSLKTAASDLSTQSVKKKTTDAEEDEEFQSASDGELDDLDEASTLVVAKKKKKQSLESSAIQTGLLSQEVIEASYLKFQILLSRLQILIVDDIRDLDAINNDATVRSQAELELLYDKFFILAPLDLFFNIHQCVYRDDVHLPAWKLFGNLPLIDFTLTDLKLENIIQLFMSIPFPKSKREDAALETEPIDEIQNTDNNNNQIDTVSENLIDSIR